MGEIVSATSEKIGLGYIQKLVYQIFHAHPDWLRGQLNGEVQRLIERDQGGIVPEQQAQIDFELVKLMHAHVRGDCRCRVRA